jgi:hypothetical protein
MKSFPDFGEIAEFAKQNPLGAQRGKGESGASL